MSETCAIPLASWSAAQAPVLEAIGREAWRLEPPARNEIGGVLRPEAAALVDRLLVRVARGRGALDVAIGEGLLALAEGDRALQLGYSGIGDYAREELGIAGRTAQAMERLARELKTRPLLRASVLGGEVSARKAQAVLPLARGEAEEGWVARARNETVRALEAIVRESAQGGPDEDETWDRICVPMRPEARARVDEAMELAGRLLGAGAPRWQRLEVICQEYLGAHPADEAAEESGNHALHDPVATKWLEAAKEGLETETRRWEYLAAADPVEAPAPADETEPRRLHERLRQLVGMRDRWDELMGHLAMLVQWVGLWRDLGFASFGHFCSERLGMAGRTVERRAWLERRFYALPALRRALREGKLSYEKARLVAGCADGTTVEGWIERAKDMKCIDLRREIERQEETKMRARGELSLPVPRRVQLLVSAAFRAARKAAGHWLSPWECLLRVAEHFIETWKGALAERRSRSKKVLSRDGGFCQVPGCSRAAAHAHHVVYRSKGGGDDEVNMVAMCSAHHLHGLHRGFIRVRGRAPDGLVWELGMGPSALAEGRTQQSGCSVLFSEDFQDGRKVDGVRVVDPFR